jgi:hypothetical protein
MKNIKQLLVATVALLSVSSMASLMQPHVPTTEDAPIRVSAGLVGGLIKPTQGFGASNVGLGIGFTHNVGYDFEYGLAVAGSWAGGPNRVFSKEAEKTSGLALEVELLARFMPQIADAFRVGGYLNVGYSNQFGGEGLKQLKDETAFGDLGLRIGLASSFGFSDMVSMYFAPAYTLTAIRFASDKVVGDDAKKKYKEATMLSGIDLPLGVWFGVADNVGLFIEANTRFTNFSKFTESWKEDVTLGVSFAM